MACIRSGSRSSPGATCPFRPTGRQGYGKAGGIGPSGPARQRSGAITREEPDHLNVDAGHGPHGRAWWALAGLAVLATFFVLGLNHAFLRATLQGAFFDPDDAMRLAEVRAWLDGQSWFDMRAMRLDPPSGSFMHWSRLVDLPTAAAIAAFSRVTVRATAERWAAVAVPTLWCAALFFAVLHLATRLMGMRAALPAALGLCASGTVLVVVAPGRIGHHAPETVALVLAVGFAVAALETGMSRRAVWSGMLVALSLAMSLETMPFDVVLTAALVALWVLRGAPRAAALCWYAVGLLVALPVFFFADVAPARWSAPTCDAFGAAHLGAGLVAAAGFAACAIGSARLGTIALRLAAAASVAALAAAYVAIAYPSCLASPFAAVDPLVRDLWLSHVVESLPLPAFARLYPTLALATFAPVALGTIGCCGAALRADDRRDGFFIVAMIALSGLALSFWQVRVISSITPLALCGGIYVATRFRPAVAACVVLLFGATTWALVLPDVERAPAEAAAAQAKAACLAPEGLAPLAALPPGSAVAPLDTGAHLIEATRLSVFAAPYHRNDDGNRYALQVFLARPDAARELLARRDVAYVIVCPGIVDLARLAARARDGLAADLLRGAVPPFLRQVPLGGTPYRVYTMSSS